MGGGGKGPIEQVEGGKITRENSPWLGGGSISKLILNQNTIAIGRSMGTRAPKLDYSPYFYVKASKTL